jgi:hypothetical protein
MGFGPQNQPGPNIPAGNPAANQLRQFGSVPQTLAANNVPAIGTVSGADSAFVEIGQTNGSQGYIEVNAGASPGAGGSLTLVFPSTPPTLFIAGNPDQFGTITQATVSNTVTISWTGTMKKNTRGRMSWQWATSR